jgi:TonB-linked SusC/RagA family outer membrane protein
MTKTNLHFNKLKSSIPKESTKCLLFLMLFFLSANSSLLQAQTKVTKSGKVTDVAGEPIIGASIFLVGSSTSTLSGMNGDFSISASPNSILRVSYIGYETKEVTVPTDGTPIIIALTEKNKFLDEVVVIGYGTSTKRDLTSSVSKLDVKSALNISVGSVSETMGGRMAGVQVSSLSGKPGDNVDIVIRGGNSITSNSTPLFVIDGFAMSDDFINTINPSDIESVEILKDASATSIYGARGANGVLIITTKKAKVGKPRIDYRGYYSVQNTDAKIDVLSPLDFVKLQIVLSGNGPRDYLTSKNMTLEQYENVPAVNYLDLIFREAPMQNHSLSISGGTQDTKYLFSGSYFKQDGVIIGSSSDRFTSKMSIDQSLSKKLHFGVTGNFSLNTILGPSPNGSSNNLIHSAWSYTPFVFSGQDPANVDNTIDINDNRNNPVLTVLNEYSQSKTLSLTGNSYLEYEPLKGLKLKVTGGITTNVLGRESFNNLKTKTGRMKGSSDGTLSESSTLNWMNDYLANYNTTLNKKHKIAALIGATLSGRSTRDISMGAQNLTRDDLGLNALAEGTPKVSSYGVSESTLASGLFRINYGYDNRYLFSASYRADGSSRFGRNNRWAYFPSSSFAWVMSEEKFMEPLQKVISNVKIRASWGRTGNNNVSDFASTEKYYGSTGTRPYTYYFGNTSNPAIVKTEMENPNLKWETTEQYDLGIDVGFFKQRIRIEADYFKKVTSDLLLNADLPYSSGFVSSYMNIGKVQNQGFEFTLTTENIQTQKLKWTTDFNISFIQNKVLELANAQPTMSRNITWAYIGDYNQFNNFPAYIAQVGKPLSLMYGWVSDGLLYNSDIANNYPTARGVSVAPGYMKFKDINGDGRIDQSDRTVIGNANPKHFGGLNNKLQFSDFDLNVFLQWSYGNDIMNVNSYLYTVASPYGYNSTALLNDAYSGTNQDGKIPTLGSQRTNNKAYYSTMVEDGSFLKVKTIQLGYSIPKKMMSKIGLQNLRIYASVDNLITFTNYSGFDPEVSTYNSPMTKGFDFSSYPRARVITVGGSITL